MVGNETQDGVDPRTEKTRGALVQAAIALFGEKGFEATTMRELAAKAGTNLAAINYHFGSRDDLRRAATRAVAEELSVRGPGTVLSNMSNLAISQMTAAQADSVLRRILGMTLLDVVHDDGSVLIQRFFRRELFSEGFELELFFELVFDEHFQLMCHLVSKVTGLEPASEPCRIKTLTLMGQAMFLGMAQPLIFRCMGWREYGHAEVGQISDALWLQPDAPNDTKEHEL